MLFPYAQYLSRDIIPVYLIIDSNEKFTFPYYNRTNIFPSSYTLSPTE